MGILNRIIQETGEAISKATAKEATKEATKTATKTAAKEVAKETSEKVSKSASKNVSKAVSRDDLVKASRERAEALRNKHGVIKDTSKIAESKTPRRKIADLTEDEMSKIMKDNNGTNSIDDLIANQRNKGNAIGSDRMHNALEDTQRSLSDHRAKMLENQLDYDNYKNFKRSKDFKNMDVNERIEFNEKNKHIFETRKQLMDAEPKLIDNLGQAKNNAALSDIRDTVRDNKDNLGIEDKLKLGKMERDYVINQSAFNSEEFGKKLEDMEAKFSKKESEFKKKQAKMSNMEAPVKNPAAKNKDKKGVGNNWVYKMAAAGVGGGMVLSMFENKGQQSNAQLYGQQGY